MPNVKCKICNNQSEKIFEKVILQKYNTGYYKCEHCGFVQTDEVTWLEEAYKSAISSLDIGLLSRNYHLKSEITNLIDCCFPTAQNMLDYAGGYGVFTRLMRDAGYNFFNHDDYCENIFAKHFDLKNSNDVKIDLVTAFEVLEHFTNPLENLKEVFQYAENAVFTTEITPESNDEIENWWYIAQETGQHVVFYTEKSLGIIAEKFNKYYYTKDRTIHVFTESKLSENQINYYFKNIHKKKYFFGLVKKKINYKSNRTSFLEKDYNYIKNLLNLK